MKEGKLEKLARQAIIEYQEFQDAQQQKDREAYPERLMKVLERASNVGYEIKVKDSMFLVSDYNSYLNVVKLTSTYSEQNTESLNELEYIITVEETRKAEAKRKSELKTTALSKLTREERDVLGL